VNKVATVEAVGIEPTGPWMRSPGPAPSRPHYDRVRRRLWRHP